VQILAVNFNIFGMGHIAGLLKVNALSGEYLTVSIFHKYTMAALHLGIISEFMFIR
jgi:hypothetical protein